MVFLRSHLLATVPTLFCLPHPHRGSYVYVYIGYIRYTGIPV